MYSVLCKLLYLIYTSTPRPYCECLSDRSRDLAPRSYRLGLAMLDTDGTDGVEWGLYRCPSGNSAAELADAEMCQRLLENSIPNTRMLLYTGCVMVGYDGTSQCLC